jgi:phenylacetate-CoA ligase
MAGVGIKIYSHLPVWAQNIGISLFGLAWRRERIGTEFQKQVTEFQARDQLSPEQMQEIITERLRTVLLQAWDNVPYYAPRWSAAGIERGDLEAMTPDTLHRLPVTPKDDLRQDPDAFVSLQARQSLRLHRYASSGSTGKPITAIYSRTAHQRFTAAREARSFGWAGASLLRSRAMIGGRAVVPQLEASPPFYRVNRFERQLYFSAFHISEHTVADYVAGFNAHRSELLTGYAHAYYYLASLMQARGMTLDYAPKALVYSSEKLTRHEREVIEQAFRTRTYEEYGSVENCLLATECEAGSLHQHPDFGVMEITDARGKPLKRGLEGKILATGLLNDAQFLIRYEIGDSGIFSPQSCACGRTHLPVVKEITGRIEDALIAPDGRLINRFHGIWIDLSAIIEGQLVQESRTRFLVRVVAARALTDAEKQILTARMKARLGEADIVVEQVPEIARTDRGKFRAVICLLTPEEKHRAMNFEQKAGQQ